MDKSQLKEKYIRFTESWIAIIACATVTVLFWHLKLPEVGLILLGLYSLANALLLKSMAASLPTALFALFLQMTNDEYRVVTYYPMLLVGYAFVIIPLIVFIVKNKIKPQLTANFWGTLALFLTLFTGGLLHENTSSLSYYTSQLARYGFIIAAYVLFHTSIRDDARTILTRTIATIGTIVTIQILIRAAIHPTPSIALSQKLLWLGWGITNAAGTILLTCIPFTLYLVYKSDKPYAYLAMLLAQYVGMALTFSRSAILILAVGTIPLFAIYIIKSANRKRAAITTAAFFATLAITGTILLTVLIPDFMNTWHLKLDDNGRNPLYAAAWESFLQHPIFGIGVTTRHFAGSFGATNVHNSILQAMYNGGIVGLIFFGCHKFAQYKAVIYKDILKNTDMFLMFCLAAFLLSDLHGMVDVIYFMRPYMVILTTTMAVIDRSKTLSNKNNTESTTPQPTT